MQKRPEIDEVTPMEFAANPTQAHVDSHRTLSQQAKINSLPTGGLILLLNHLFYQKQN